MINQTQSEDVELEGIENQYWVDLAEALERLYENKDFKKVILEGYFKDKAVDQVSLLATSYVQQSGTRGPIMEELVAISALENHFKTIFDLGTPVPVDEDELDG